MDYYKTLGVEKGVSEDALKKAYHKLAMKYHPDRNPGDADAEKKFKEINEAYEVLKDADKRAKYDQYGKAGFSQQQGFGDFSDVFNDIFSDFMGTSRRPEVNTRGSDLRYNLNISLEEAFRGRSYSISFKSMSRCSPCSGTGSADKASGIKTCEACNGRGTRRVQQGFFVIEQTCNYCAGSGKLLKNPCKSCGGEGRSSFTRNLSIDIPAGIENGTKMRISGEGEAGIRGGSSGDLYVFVSVNEHKFFKVDRSDLHCKVDVPITTAVLGGDLEVPTIDGGSISVNVPAGTQFADKLRLKGLGMSKVRSSSRGDMYVHISVEIPKKLSQKQKELFEQIHKDFQEEKGGFFNKVKNFWSS